MESLDEMELASPHGPHDHGGHRTNLAHDYELLKRRHNLAQQGMLFFFGLMCLFLLVNYYGHTGHFEAATAGCDTPEDPHGHPHPTPGPSPTPTPTAPALMDLVGKEAILQRMQGLQDIAFNIGNGTRVVGTKGFQASVDYVLEQLQKPLANHGWQATRQHFGMNMPHLSSTPVLQELEPRHMPHAFNTTNVIVDVPGGDKDNIIVMGAHLDSVAAGPGINDNGSGAMTIMEIAIQISKKYGKIPSSLPALRFCFWGGEEEGLLGSEHYVKDLTDNNPAGLQAIVLNLNFDMLASPNFVRGVYNGLSGPDAVKNASAGISDMFIDHFKTVGKPWVFSDFNGRSDYGPFIEAGIPAGGLDSGAEGIKTDIERHMFGGMSKTAYDPCYHQACDTIDNCNHEALDSLAKGAASVLESMLHTVGLREKLHDASAKHYTETDIKGDERRGTPTGRGPSHQHNRLSESGAPSI